MQIKRNLEQKRPCFGKRLKDVRQNFLCHFHRGVEGNLDHLVEGGLPLVGGECLLPVEMVGDRADAQRPLAEIGGVGIASVVRSYSFSALNEFSFQLYFLQWSWFKLDCSFVII